MTRVVKFPIAPPQKLGPKRARRRRKPNLEDFGQLNLFAGLEESVRVISMPKERSFFQQAVSLDEAGDVDAERFYLLAITHDDSTADAYCNLGILKYQEEDFGQSINYLTKCLELEPRHFEAHYNLANVYADMSNLTLAKTHYEVSIQIDPEFPDSYYNLSLVLVSMKSYEEAIGLLYQYINIADVEERKMAMDLIKTLKALG